MAFFFGFTNIFLFLLFIYLFFTQRQFNQINQVSSLAAFVMKDFNCAFIFVTLKDFAVFNWLQQSESCLLKYALRCLCQFLYHYYYQRFQYFSKDQLFSQALFPRRILPNRFLFIWSITSGRGAYSKREVYFKNNMVST